MTEYTKGQSVRLASTLFDSDGVTVLLEKGAVGTVSDVWRRYARDKEVVSYDVEFANDHLHNVRADQIRPHAEERLSDDQEGEYAIVELFGRHVIVGQIAEAVRYGVAGIVIRPLYRGRMLAEIWRAGSAIYGVSPVSKDDAIRLCPEAEDDLPPSVRSMLPLVPAEDDDQYFDPDARFSAGDCVVMEDGSQGTINTYAGNGFYAVSTNDGKLRGQHVSRLRTADGSHGK